MDQFFFCWARSQRRPAPPRGRVVFPCPGGNFLWQLLQVFVERLQTRHRQGMKSRERTSASCTNLYLSMSLRRENFRRNRLSGRTKSAPLYKHSNTFVEDTHFRITKHPPTSPTNTLPLLESTADRASVPSPRPPLAPSRLTPDVFFVVAPCRRTPTNLPSRCSWPRPTRSIRCSCGTS